MKKNKLSITTPMLAATTVLLVAANLLLGGILMRQSRNSMRSLIRARMLDVSNTAADMIDGDAYAKLTANSADTPEYQQTLRVLRSFLDNIELSYIYGVREEDGRFIFTIDPDDDPGQFGEEIATTEALINASKGKADVDNVPLEDRWGRFYSAYSPIFDSSGNVVGMVAVDFSAEWYESRIRSNIIAIVLVCSASTIMGILMAFTLSARLRKRFNELYNEMNDLAVDFQGLNKLIKTNGSEAFDAAADTPEEPPNGIKKDEIAVLSKQIRSFRTNLQQYLTYVHSQAFTDTMTGVGSKTAYLNKVKSIEKQIKEGSADFAVAVFDMNGLKNVNDNYGHEMGDKFIIGAAEVIKSVFKTENVYRIGGDEFIAVLDGIPARKIDTLFEKLDIAVKELNSTRIYPIELSIAKGADLFFPGSDSEYNHVFKRADDAMYRCKEQYKKNHK